MMEAKHGGRAYMTKKKAFQLYADYRSTIDALSDEEAGQLIKAVFAHEDGEEPALSGALRGIFLLLANQLDRDRARYEEMCARNRNNGAKGGRPPQSGKNPDESAETRVGPAEPVVTEENPEKPTVTQGKPKKPDKDTDKDTDTDTDTEKKSVSVCGSARRPHTPSPKKAFVPPTLEEVMAYCAERGNSVDAQRFIDFYESKGWMVGSSPMRDWRASVRGWERDERASPKPGDSPPDTPPQPVYSEVL
jgi:hypothetical protein